MIWTLATVILLLLTPVGVCGASCESPQYLERGKTGIVECHFSESYYAIFWYNTSDFLHSDPIAYVKNEERVGNRYETSEYTITGNGSLVITNVSLKDDRNFTVIILDSPIDEYSPNNIHVVVTVKSYQMQPHIDGCGEDSRACFKSVNGTSELSCSVKDARPPVDLKWYMRTIAADTLLVSDKHVTFNDPLYTTVAKTMHVSGFSKNVVYVCKSDSHPLLLKNEYSLVLVENDSKNFELIHPSLISVRQSAKIELDCTDRPSLYVVWKKMGPTNRNENLINILFTDQSRFTKFHSYQYTIANQTSLRISEVDVTDEGLYSCTFGDGISERVKMYNLQVYVIPYPEKPVVEGCTVTGSCSLSVHKTGVLTCSLKGIRPKMELRWETVEDYDKGLIDFSTASHKVEGNGSTYDVILKSYFRIKDSHSRWISIRCRVFGFGDLPFDMSREVYLIQLEGPWPEHQTSEESPHGNNRWKTVFSIVDALLTFAVVAGLIIYCVMKRKRRHKKTDEEIPMIERNKPTDEKIRIFKKELHTKYSNTWENMYPLPFEKSLHFAVNEIFIEGKIEQLEKVEDQKFGKFYNWKKLESYNDIVKVLRQSQVEIILEGEPGIGKTTLGYQFAFDWATKNTQSPLSDTDIYILLRLRYLKDAYSIPGAIRKFLLPKNSALTVEDVKNILYFSDSVVIFLDGYDTFSYDKKSETMFMKDIRTNDICPKCQVIVSTKPFCLPDEHVNSLSRMRLAGFGDASWRKYLKKAVAIDNNIEEDRIMKILHENPLLRDLCQVPLLFVLFAHITKTSGTFGSGCNTMTTFFQTVIDSFHSKISDEVKEHTALSSVCFETLLKEKKGLIWKKETMYHKLGENLYNEYVRVGLLVEKEFCKYKGKDVTRNNRNVKYVTKVRFFHDVFCEWYAAKKLAQVFKTSSYEECKEYLEKIHPFYHQYVYRFACGFDKEGARKIINCFQSIKDGEKFAILCIIEQPEDFTNVEDTIRNICSSPVIIAAYDNLFLQRSTVQLLQFASKKEINIEHVCLVKTKSTFDEDTQSLKLASGIFLPKLTSLQQLSVYDPYRKLSKEELIGFLKYVSLCDSLKDLRFQACLLPFLQPDDLENIRTAIGTKTIKVQWELPVLERNSYTLDIQSGGWLHEDERMSEQKYRQVVQSFRMSFKVCTTEDSRDNPGPSTSASA